MLDRALMRLDGTRIGMRVLDTVGLARRLLAGRIARFEQRYGKGKVAGSADSTDAK